MTYFNKKAGADSNSRQPRDVSIDEKIAQLSPESQEYLAKILESTDIRDKRKAHLRILQLLSSSIAHLNYYSMGNLTKEMQMEFNAFLLDATKVFATKEDLKNLEDRLEKKIDEVKDDLKDDLKEVKADLKEVKADLKDDIKKLTKGMWILAAISVSGHPQIQSLAVSIVTGVKSVML